MTEPDLTVKLGDLKLKNPVITASGTSGYGDELEDYMDPERLGAITVKGLTREPTTGNPTPRIVETASGLLNSIGLENPGLEEFLDSKLDVIKKFDLPVFVNISGHSVDDFGILAESLAGIPQIAGLEVNVSCPNIEGGGIAFGTEPEMIYNVTSRVKKCYDKFVIVKLSPNVTDIEEMALAAEEGGADAISLINTLLGMAIDSEKQKPVLGNTFGGLSGPAIKPVALRMVYQVAVVTDLPLIGMGGIMTGEDAIEFLLAGASAVGVGTATLVNPDAGIKIVRGISEYMKRNQITGLDQIIGKVHT